MRLFCACWRLRLLFAVDQCSLYTLRANRVRRVAVAFAYSLERQRSAPWCARPSRKRDELDALRLQNRLYPTKPRFTFSTTSFMRLDEPQGCRRGREGEEGRSRSG